MVRRLLLPLLGLALFAATAATAQPKEGASQTLPANQAPSKKEIRQAARATRRAGRVLSKRELKAQAAARAAAAKAVAAAAAPAPTAWSGWNNDPLPETDATTLYHPHTNVAAAPGMPLNQVGHGVTTDYDGHPIRKAPAASPSVTMAAQR